MSKKYTFNPETRYMTCGINEKIPLAVQVFIWNEIDKLLEYDIEADYLQVFDIKVFDQYIEIVHRQEVPDYNRIHRLKKNEMLNEIESTTIFVIDDEDHSTMLLSSEY